MTSYSCEVVVAQVDKWFLTWRSIAAQWRSDYKCEDEVAHAEKWLLMWRCCGSSGEVIAQVEK